MSDIEVIALQVGHSAVDASVRTYLSGGGEMVVIPHTVLLVRRDFVFLVDTGVGDAEQIRHAYPQDIWRSPEEDLEHLLLSQGLLPTDIDLVVNTHLHYDHVGNNHLFPHATIMAQRTEIDYALGPTAKIMEREYLCASAGFIPPYESNRITPVDGDTTITEGLDLIHLPGHTPGSQGVLIESPAGLLCFAGDQVMVLENMDPMSPVGLHTDIEAWQRSHAKLLSTDAKIIPSHDGRLFTQGLVQRIVN